MTGLIATMADDRTHEPLKDAIVCCTSIEADLKDQIIRWTEQMGGVHKHDLTSDVTHLIVGDITTHKYMFVAKERLDVRCMMPEWLEAANNAWREGHDVDFKSLEDQYVRPIFYRLNIAITGFVERRSCWLWYNGFNANLTCR